MADKDNFYASDLVDLNMMSPPVEQQSKQVFVKERDGKWKYIIGLNSIFQFSLFT